MISTTVIAGPPTHIVTISPTLKSIALLPPDWNIDLGWMMPRGTLREADDAVLHTNRIGSDSLPPCTSMIVNGPRGGAFSGLCGYPSAARSFLSWRAMRLHRTGMPEGIQRYVDTRNSIALSQRDAIRGQLLALRAALQRPTT